MVKHISIDIGTSNTVIAEASSGVILNEPSVVAVDLNTKQLIAVGEEAKNLLYKTPKDISVITPIKNGVVADFEIASAMLKSFILNCYPKGVLRPKATLCIPHDITDVENKTLLECVLRANAKCDYTFHSSLAASLGVGIDVFSAMGNMILDIGGGKVCASVVSFGGVVSSTTAFCGGNKMDEAIVNFIKKNYGLKIGKKTAEEAKIKIGSCYDENKAFSIMGRDDVLGLPKEITVVSSDIKEALKSELSEIIDVIKTTLENTPPELIKDICENGICLCGGGAKLSGLDKFIGESVGIHTYMCENPKECACLGANVLMTRGVS